MLSLQDIDNIVLNGGIVVDSAGEKIGSVEQVFTSGDSGDPVFVTVRTGLFGMGESFAPLSGASLVNSVIKVAFAKDKVKNGPRIESERGVITETQEQELYSYYGLVAQESNDAAAANDTEDTGLAPADTPSGENAPDLPLPMAHGGPHPPHGGPPPPHGGPHPPHPPHLHKHVPLPPHPGPPPPHRPPGPPPKPGDRQ